MVVAKAGRLACQETEYPARSYAYWRAHRERAVGRDHGSGVQATRRSRGHPRGGAGRQSWKQTGSGGSKQMATRPARLQLADCLQEHAFRPAM